MCKKEDVKPTERLKHVFENIGDAKIHLTQYALPRARQANKQDVVHGTGTLPLSIPTWKLTDSGYGKTRIARIIYYKCELQENWLMGTKNQNKKDDYQ